MWTTSQRGRNHFMVQFLWLQWMTRLLKIDFVGLMNLRQLFVDLQLDVKGCKDVYASFDKYVEVERLEGDNRYHAEQYGLQVRCLGEIHQFNLLTWKFRTQYLDFTF